MRRLLALVILALALLGCDRVFIDPVTGAVCTVSDADEFGSSLYCELGP